MLYRSSDNAGHVSSLGAHDLSFRTRAVHLFELLMCGNPTIPGRVRQLDTNNISKPNTLKNEQNLKHEQRFHPILEWIRQPQKFQIVDRPACSRSHTRRILP